MLNASNKTEIHDLASTCRLTDFLSGKGFPGLSTSCKSILLLPFPASAFLCTSHCQPASESALSLIYTGAGAMVLAVFLLLPEGDE
jgi:hypothetical protein